MSTQINKPQTKTLALVASYLVLSAILYVSCALWSSLNPETSRTIALLSSLPMGPLFVMETGNMISVLPAYAINAMLILALLRGSKQEAASKR